MRLEILLNTGYVREFSTVNFAGVPFELHEQAAADYGCTVASALNRHGFVCQPAEGRRGTCGGWEEATCHAQRWGIVGAIDEPEGDEAQNIEAILADVERNWRSDWVAY